jgi:phosphatidate cytidylyltransferase
MCAVLKTRVITALLMLLVLYAATTWTSPLQFVLFVSIVLLLAAQEWTSLMGLQGRNKRASYVVLFLLLMICAAWFLGIRPGVEKLAAPIVIVVTGLSVLFWLWAFVLIRAFPQHTHRWSSVPRTAMIGIFVLLPTWVALIQLKYLAPSGYLVFVAIALVSVADIGAYFIGRAWGRSKLAPSLSPGKSWAGVWGGLLSSAILAGVLLSLLNANIRSLTVIEAVLLLGIAMLVAILSVVGDLFESMLKRQQGLKDSGAILPGHGGVLDRIDSLTAAAPAFVFFLMIIFADVAW